VFQNQHWTLDEKKRDLLVSSGAANPIVCPACRKIASHDPHGIVTLRGDYWPQHREDILNLIRNEEARGMAANPLERIIDIREEEDALIIETTNEKLAQRLGRSIHNAHKGAVEYKWPDGNRLVRVEWERSSG
jgi:NMD protein affecting ribosome stability and mRNA decay